MPDVFAEISRAAEVLAPVPRRSWLQDALSLRDADAVLRHAREELARHQSPHAEARLKRAVATYRKVLTAVAAVCVQELQGLEATEEVTP